MKIDEMVAELLKIKAKHGNLEVVGADDYDLDCVEVQKYFKTSSPFNNIISRQTEDMDDTYLEEMYIHNDRYKEQFVSQGVCVRMY